MSWWTQPAPDVGVALENGDVIIEPSAPTDIVEIRISARHVRRLYYFDTGVVTVGAAFTTQMTFPISDNAIWRFEARCDLRMTSGADAGLCATFWERHRTSRLGGGAAQGLASSINVDAARHASMTTGSDVQLAISGNDMLLQVKHTTAGTADGIWSFLVEVDITDLS